MVITDQEVRPTSQLEITRLKVIRLLDERLATGGKLGLRKHQMPVMHDWRKDLDKGNTAGYIELPTGAGKTVVAAKFAELGLNTIVVSPTGEILDKTKKTIENHAEDISVSNFDGRMKDLTGNVINTTLPSLETIAQIPAIAEGVELVIVDETHHGTLGRKRHELWRKFPNAIFVGLTATPDFSQLDELERRGVVDPNERWTGMFKNRIHQLTREEAQQQGALAPLDIHMVTTNSVVGHVHISKGEYDERELDAMLNTEARNVQVMALLAGKRAIPSSIKMSEEKRAQLQEIHELIKGKKTAIFGLNIAHIEALAQRLRDEGIKAAAVHGKLSRKMQTAFIEAYEQGRFDVILGVDLLGLGWDSPATEVGIFMRPRKTDVPVIQEVGRLLRLSEETGKQRAIAVQLVDQFEDPTDRPVYIPEVVDPDYILQGQRKLGVGKRQKGTEKAERESTITLSGMDIETVKELVAEVSIRKRFEAAGSVKEIGTILDEIITKARKGSHEESVVDFYRNLARLLPSRLSQKIQDMLLEDRNDPERKRAFLLLNLKSIFSVVQPYFTDNEAHNEEIIHTAIMQVNNRFDKFRTAHVPIQINQLLKKGEVVTVAAQEEGVPQDWVHDRNASLIVQSVDDAIAGKRAKINQPLTSDEVRELVDDLEQATGYERKALEEIVIFRDTRLPTRENAVINPASSPADTTLVEALHSQLDSLSERESGVLMMRHGIGTEDGKPMTLDEVGKVYGVTRERIRFIQSQALSKLRHPQRRNQIKGTE